MQNHTSLQKKIETRKATVGVVGLGYVGLPLLAAFHRAGFPVIGFDTDPNKIERIHRGENYLKHLGDTLVSDMKRAGRFDATTDRARLAEADAVIICVPTPLGPHLEPDMTYVERAADDAARTLRAGQLIVLESSTYPGTTREIVLSRLAKSGLKLGEEYFVAYSPEREDPGRLDYQTATIPKLVGGVDPISGEIAVALYRGAIKEIVPVSTAEVAEAAKLLENIYRAVNIALVNEMKLVLSAMNIDVWEVIAAAATKPFGFQAFYPGPGLGGHCIPVDPYYLTWKAREAGVTTRFIELAGEVNRRMPRYVVEQVVLALNERSKPVKGARVLVLGLAYKPDVDDVRESPSFELIEELDKLGARVDYHDPHVAATHRMRRYDLQMKSLASPLTAAAIRPFDCVLISTNHSDYDWQLIADSASLVVDTRNAMRDVRGKRDHIVRA